MRASTPFGGGECRAPLYEECPQHHGHKGTPEWHPGLVAPLMWGIGAKSRVWLCMGVRFFIESCASMFGCLEANNIFKIARCGWDSNVIVFVPFLVLFGLPLIVWALPLLEGIYKGNNIHFYAQGWGAVLAWEAPKRHVSCSVMVGRRLAMWQPLWETSRGSLRLATWLTIELNMRVEAK